MNKLRIIVFLFIITNVSVALPPNRRVNTGRTTRIEQYPFAVQVRRGGYTVCGATIISQSVVMTAAHCFFLSGQIGSTLMVGSSINGHGEEYGLIGVHVHPKYSPHHQDFDIALLYTVGLIAFSFKVSAAKLPPPGFELAPGNVVAPVGWGKLNIYDRLGSEQLMEVELVIISRTECQSKFNRLSEVEITKSMICAGDLRTGGRDTCHGDSGGPLVYKDMVIGITSWGVGCARVESPGIYTNVAEFVPWIKSNQKYVPAKMSPLMIVGITISVLIGCILLAVALFSAYKKFLHNKR